MKVKTKAIVFLAALLVSGSTLFAQSNQNTNEENVGFQTNTNMQNYNQFQRGGYYCGANCNQFQRGGGYGYGMNNYGFNKKFHKRGYGMRGGYGMGQGMGGSGLMFLNGIMLSNEQMYKISILQDEMMLEMRKANSSFNDCVGKYFNEAKFDKNAMIKDHKSRANKNIETRGEYIEKIYNILTPEQKKQAINNYKSFLL